MKTIKFQIKALKCGIVTPIQFNFTLKFMLFCDAMLKEKHIFYSSIPQLSE